MTEKNIILVGLGPHAQRIYYPLLDKYAAQYRIRVTLIIDLQDQADKIEDYLTGYDLKPGRVLLLDESQRISDRLDNDLRAILEEIEARHPLHGMIIATEPKTHLAYAQWALEAGIDVLMDKPLSAPIGARTNVDAARKIFDDYLQLENKLLDSPSNFIVQCQRRNHVGYQYIHSYLNEFLASYNVPISYFDIYHADGMWPMPNEIFERENHPYKYGYGKLMHSGYHFVDLFAWLSELNHLIQHKQPDTVDLVVRHFGPFDFLHQFDDHDYDLLFGSEEFSRYFAPHMIEQAREFGELDVFILCQLKRDDVVVSTASITLQQNSFGRRAWSHPPVDVYKGNGRVRHERLVIQAANLLNIQVHSYQSYEVGRQDVEVSDGAGHEDHFDIHFYRNTGVVGGKPLEKIQIGSSLREQHHEDGIYLGHNEEARERNFIDFLERREGVSHLLTHRRTNRMLSAIYECLARAHNGDSAHLTFALEHDRHHHHDWA